MTIKELDVYKVSISLAVEVYGLTANFPKSEMFGLTSQMRRASTSIPSNLAEGAARNNRKELIHFIGIARGSCAELLTLIEIAEAVKLVSEGLPVRTTIDRVARMLTQLQKSLRDKGSAPGLANK